MTIHLHTAIEDLKRLLLGLSATVEEAVIKALKAVETRDQVLAKTVIEGDKLIDMKEVEVEEECLKVLALHQPVATDLRFIVSVLKINNDLERIGDLAVNMAKRAKALSSVYDPSTATVDFKDAQSKVQGMLRRSLESFVNLDADKARQVCAADDEIDEINRDVHRQVIEKVKQHPQAIDQLMIFLSVSKNLERIADHATNVAEDVIYMVSGEIVRHGRVG